MEFEIHEVLHYLIEQFYILDHLENDEMDELDEMHQ